MSDLTFNKIAGGVLATGLAIFLLKELTTELFIQEPPEKPGYSIAVVEAVSPGGGPAAPEVPPDWGTILPTADVAAGQTVSAKCASCHQFDPAGTNGTGPGLFGVVGRKTAGHPGYMYSQAMVDEAAKSPVWTYDALFEYLKNPQKVVPGTKMSFVGLPKAEDRIAIIAYLHTLGSTLPIPAPKPAAPAAEAPDADDAAAPSAEAAPPAKG